MPIYTMLCPLCDEVSEHIMGMDDNTVHVKCPGCGEPLTRMHNRLWGADLPQIQGDTCSGNHGLWDYYDPILKKHITSKQQRSDEMKRQGLVEWQPDPIEAKYTNEREYIKKQSRPGDQEAARARKKLSEAAQKERQKAAVDRAFDRAKI